MKAIAPAAPFMVGRYPVRCIFNERISDRRPEPCMTFAAAMRRVICDNGHDMDSLPLCRDHMRPGKARDADTCGACMKEKGVTGVQLTVCDESGNTVLF